MNETIKKCAIEDCPNTFTPKGKQIYCSQNCGKKAWRLKNADKARATIKKYDETHKLEKAEKARLRRKDNPDKYRIGTVLSPDEIYYKDYKEPLKKVDGGYGYMGTLAYSKEMDKVQCHICGLGFHALGSHVRHVHKIDTSQYRERFQLAKQTALIGEGMREKFVRNGNKIIATNLEALQEGRTKLANEGYFKGKRTRYLSLEEKNVKGTCPDQLLDKIEKLATRLKRAPSTKEFINEYGKDSYYRNVIATFGSWVEALRILGLQSVKELQDEKYSPTKLLEYLKIFYCQHGRLASVSDTKRGLVPNFNTYTKHFGSINKARMAANLPVMRTIFSNGRFINMEAIDHLSLEQKEWVERARHGEFKEEAKELIEETL